MELKEKKKYINLITLNTFMILGFIAGINYLVLPGYDTMNTITLNAESLIKSIDTYKTTGPDVDTLRQILVSNKINKGVTDLFSDKNKIEAVVKKDPKATNYLDWVQEESLKESAYSKDVEKNERIIGSIIPLFFEGYQNLGENGSSDIKQLISLDTFVNFIETKLLRENNITSYSPLGIDKIDFGGGPDEVADPTASKVAKKENSENIGSFSLKLDIEGSDKDMLGLIDYIQKSGKLIIKDGKLMNEVTENDSQNSTLDNLLMTIDSVDFPEIPYKESVDVKPHKGSLTLRFYVRGISYEQLNTIKSRVATKFSDLYKGVNNDAKLCNGGEAPICKDGVGTQAVANVRALVNNVNKLKKRIDEKNKENSIALDVNIQLSDWLSISSATDTISFDYNKSKKIISEFSKKGTK